MERREILHGFHGLFWTNTVTALFATYLLNGGPTMIYYDIDAYGWSWVLLQVPVLFVAMVSRLLFTPYTYYVFRFIYRFEHA